MISIESELNIPVVAVKGRIDGLTAGTIEPRVTDALDGGTGLVIDLSEVTYIASVGLRILVLAAKRCARAGRGFAVCGLQPSVQDVFEVAGLDMLLTICATRREALASVVAGQ